MSQIGRQLGQGLLYVHSLLVPAIEAMDGKGVSEVVKAWLERSTIVPAYPCDTSYALEDAS